MLKIYHVPGTRSVRVIWLCEELDLPYETVPVDFSPDYRASAEWRAMNPVGKVPVMVDGTTKLFESGAMVQYLLARYGEGRLQPAVESADYGLFLQWCWFAEATFARPLGEIVNHRREFPGEREIPEVIQEMERRAVVCLDALENEVRPRGYLVGGAFGAADIMMGYSIFLARRFKLLGEQHSNVAGYFAGLTQRDGFATAIADMHTGPLG